MINQKDVKQVFYVSNSRYFYDQAVCAFKGHSQKKDCGDSSIAEEFLYIGEPDLSTVAIAHHKNQSSTIVLKEYHGNGSGVYVTGTAEGREAAKSSLEKLTGFQLQEEAI